MAVTVCGLILTLISVFCNGTFNTFGKLCREAPDPVIFNLFLCLGTGLSSCAAIALMPLAHPEDPWQIGFTLEGFLAGCALVYATLFTFAAIPLIGLAKGAPTFCTFAILTAFSWGAVGPSNPGPGAPVKSVLLSILAIGLIIGGVVIINFALDIAKRLLPPRDNGKDQPQAVQPQDIEVVHPQDIELDKQPPSSGKDQPQAVQPQEIEVVQPQDIELGKQPPSGGKDQPQAVQPQDIEVVQPPDIELDKQPPSSSGIKRWKAVLGLAFAFASGAFGGSILVPASYVSPEFKGLRVVPSFGLGASTMGLLATAVYSAIWRRNLRKEIRREVVWKGIAAGLVWNIGNVCQIAAMDIEGMPYGIAAPLFHCALAISGTVGIYFFKEITDQKAIAVFWMGVMTLLSGAVCLGLNGPGAE
eukprot:TRINITY_DN12359_c1_g1_i1.p1 TRINITY_DN12359_c1_g1~~TRINITY_DN12359_c1_g1_i1.p1  ORF type:complete len:416 (-),score=84.92 TRINITY_DN12359_c1_g1_i1:34-1281(-)